MNPTDSPVPSPTSTLSSDGRFAEKVLGWKPWEAQLRIMRSIRDHRRTLVMAGHAVGKTRTLASLIIEWMAMRPGARVVCTATTNKQVHSILWAEVRKLIDRAPYLIGGELKETKWRFRDRLAEALSVDDPTAIQGVHGRANLVVVDEAEGVHQSMWDSLETLLSSKGSRMVLCFNPVTTSGYCYEAAQRPDLFNVISVSCLDHPNVRERRQVIEGAVTHEWIEEMRQRHGEDSPFWSSRVLGRFPASSTNSLVTMTELMDSDAPTQVVDEPRIGLDVARFGDDRSVLVVLDRSRTVIECQSWTKTDLMETTGRLRDAMRRHGVASRRVGVDVCGMGAGVVDRLAEDGIRCTPVDFGSAADGDWGPVVGREAQFTNRRSELHWVARSLLRRRELRIPAQWKEIWADLCAPSYWFDGRGRIAVESKDEIKARIKRSPDFSDAVLIALGAGGTKRPMIQ